MRLPGVFRAFRHRNFRLFIAGQLISLIGTWAQRLAVGWLAWELTHSAFWVGAVSFAGLFPGVLVGPFAGSVADSMSRLRLLKISQFAFLVQAGILAALTIGGVITLPILLVLEAALAIITAFDIPARQAFVIEMVGKEDLPNAIAINSISVNIARMIGPAIAGVIIVTIDIGEAFLFNSISYIAVLASLSALRLDPRPAVRRLQPLASHVFDGLRYAWQERGIRTYLLLFFLTALFGMPYGSLLPVVAEQRFSMGAGGLTWLVSGSGLGATLGALLLAARKDTRGLPKKLFLAGLGFGSSLVVFGLIGDFTLAVAFVPVLGFGMMMQMAGNNIILQTHVDEAQRGRVMSMLSMSFQLAMPLGSLWMGSVAEHFGDQAPFLFGGISVVIAVTTLGLFSSRSLQRA
ncbi:MAG: MFS transporter [Bacteroidota bacterium]|jgi:MFS family permease|nr:MFS transporter [Bacteroidota bacterium]